MKFEDAPEDEEVDRGKLEIIVKFAIAMEKKGPPMLILVDDDWCWAQFHMLKFLKKRCFVFVKKELADCHELIYKIPKGMEIHHWNNQKELNELSLKCAEKFRDELESEST